MADKQVEEMTPGEREIKQEEFAFWVSLPVTQEFRRRLIARFDHQQHILSGTPGLVLQGRAEVLECILRPWELFEE